MAKNTKLGALQRRHEETATKRAKYLALARQLTQEMDVVTAQIRRLLKDKAKKERDAEIRVQKEKQRRAKEKENKKRRREREMAKERAARARLG